MSKIILILYILTTSAGLLILKWGTKTGLPVSYVNNKLLFNVNLYTVGGIILYGLSFVLYVYLISKNDLGYIIPITAAFVYILIFIGSFVIFHESFTAPKIIGIALVLSGIVVLNVK